MMEGHIHRVSGIFGKTHCIFLPGASNSAGKDRLTVQEGHDIVSRAHIDIVVLGNPFRSFRVECHHRVRCGNKHRRDEIVVLAPPEGIVDVAKRNIGVRALVPGGTGNISSGNPTVTVAIVIDNIPAWG